MSQRFVSVSEFIDQYTQLNTKRQYVSSLKSFLGFVYSRNLPRGRKALSQLDELASRYLNEDRDFEQDISNFVKSLNHAAPKTVNLKVSAIRTFLLENNVTLSEYFWKRKLRRLKKGSKAISKDRAPTKDELRKILDQSPIQGRTLWLLLASSGVRIDEALHLEVDDIDFQRRHINVRADISKIGERRDAFFTDETARYLKEWIDNQLDRYWQQTIARSKYPKERDHRIFPFTYQTAQKMWNNATDKAKLNKIDRHTRRRELHIHVLRKFFRSNLALSAPLDIVEALMGHEAYLTEAYRRYTLRQMEHIYREGEQHLTIIGNPSNHDIDQMNRLIVDQATHIDRLDTELKSVRAVLEKQDESLLQVTALEEENQKFKQAFMKQQQEPARTPDVTAELERLKTLNTALNERMDFLEQLLRQTAEENLRRQGAEDPKQLIDDAIKILKKRGVKEYYPQPS